MNNLFFIISICFLLSQNGIAQTTTERYFKNQYNRKIVAKEKAEVLETISCNIDGTTTIEFKNLKTNQIIRNETYKGEEPVGIWKYERSSGILELDYDFELNYTNSSCPDTLLINNINSFFEDNDSLNYKAPVIASGKNIYQFLAKELVYPAKARETGISGKVYLLLRIAENGEISDISIKRGTHILLDKESVRAIRNLKLSSPPILDGKVIRGCFTFPISYKLS